MRLRTARINSCCNRPFGYQLAEFVEQAKSLHGDAGLRQFIAQTKLDKLPDRGRLQIDADAKWCGIGHRLINANLDPGLMQA
jgi:hypothetical protein